MCSFAVVKKRDGLGKVDRGAQCEQRNIHGLQTPPGSGKFLFFSSLLSLYIYIHIYIPIYWLLFILVLSLYSAFIYRLRLSSLYIPALDSSAIARTAGCGWADDAILFAKKKKRRGSLQFCSDSCEVLSAAKRENATANRSFVRTSASTLPLSTGEHDNAIRRFLSIYIFIIISVYLCLSIYLARF